MASSGGRVGHGTALGLRVDHDLPGERGPAVLAEKAQRKAREQARVRPLHDAPPGKEPLDDELAHLPGLQGIHPQGPRKAFVEKEEGLGGLGLQGVRQAHAQERRPPGRDLVHGLDLAGDAPHVAPRDDPGDDHRGEHRRQDDVEVVVARVRRGDRDDQAHQDVPQAEVGDPDFPVGNQSGHG